MTSMTTKHGHTFYLPDTLEEAIGMADGNADRVFALLRAELKRLAKSRSGACARNGGTFNGNMLKKMRRGGRVANPSKTLRKRFMALPADVRKQLLAELASGEEK